MKTVDIKSSLKVKKKEKRERELAVQFITKHGIKKVVDIEVKEVRQHLNNKVPIVRSLISLIYTY